MASPSSTTMAFNHQPVSPIQFYPAENESDCFFPPPPPDQRTRGHFDRRSNVSTRLPSCSLESLVEDCPHAKFVNFLVCKRQAATGLDDYERNECPMPMCRGVVFRDFGEMVDHLQTCPEVASGLYFCWDHRRVEEFPLGNCRSCKCRWAQPKSFLKSVRHGVKQGVKQGVKKAFPTTHWKSPRVGKRTQKQDWSPTPTSPASETSGEHMDRGDLQDLPGSPPDVAELWGQMLPLELMGQEVIPELMGQEVSQGLPESWPMHPSARQGLSTRSEGLTSFGMTCNFASYPVCRAPRTELPVESAAVPSHYQSPWPSNVSTYPRSTVSSMTLSGSGSSFSQISPRTTLSSLPRGLSLSIDTSVGGNLPAWTSDPVCQSPTEIENAGNGVNLHWQEQKQHSWDSTGTFVGSSTDSVLEPYFKKDHSFSELEGSLPLSQPQEMPDSSFTARDMTYVPVAEMPSLPHEQDFAAGGGWLLSEMPGSSEGEIPAPAVDSESASLPAWGEQDFIGNREFEDFFSAAHASDPTHVMDGVILSEQTSASPYDAQSDPLHPEPPCKRPKHTRRSRATKRKRSAPPPSPPLELPPSDKVERCSVCNRIFLGADRRKVRQRHETTHAETEVIFVCGLALPDGSACPSSYNRRDNFVQHRRKVEHAHGSGGGGTTTRRRQVLKKRM